MPALTRTTPITQNRVATEQGSAAGSAQHRVDVGSVIEASTRGQGGVQGDIAGASSTQAITCVDPAEMLQRLQAPTTPGGASASNAYSISAEVRLDMAVDMQAQAEAMARVVGDVVRDEGRVDLACPTGEAPPAAEPIASTAPTQSRPTQATQATQTTQRGS